MQIIPTWGLEYVDIACFGLFGFPETRAIWLFSLRLTCMVQVPDYISLGSDSLDSMSSCAEPA